MRLHTYLTSCEVRRVVDGVRQKDGKPFVALRLEDMEGEPFEVNCNDQQLFGSLYQLRKGDIVDLKVTIMATNQYQFVSLDNAPEIHEDE